MELPQPITVLQTKLYMPQAHPRSVSRPGLWAHLQAGLSGKVTLITAPAGFGKTTLASQWLSAVGAGRPAVAWLSLEEADNHTERFWTYVADALAPYAAEAAAGLKRSLQGPQLPAPEVLLLPLINGFLATEGQVVLVLDDYHAIAAPAIHDTVAFLVEHLPPALHLVLVSRGDPPLPLARWRARGELVEIRAQDLRFTLEETAGFLNGAKGLALSPPLVEALHERTEGWVTGLQLAALSLKGSPDPAAFVRAFAGSHRYVLDYLMDEVLQHQPPHVQRFLLETSILTRLSAPLCTAVTGMAESQPILQTLEEADLFLMPLDDDRQWYRYHHLFADMLRAHLKHVSPGVVGALHSRACEWCAAAGLAEEAIGHAMAAQAWDRAAQLLEAAAESTWTDGTLRQTLTWLELLPAETLRRRPRLALLYARALIPSGRVNPMAQLVADAALAAACDPGLAGQVVAMQAQLARLRGELDAALALSQQALALLAPTDWGWRGLTALSLGACYRLAGRLTEARQAYGEAALDCGDAGNLFLTVTAGNLQAEVYQQQGELRKAMAAFQAVTRRTPPHLPVAGWSLVGEGGILREWNRLAEAATLLTRGIALGRSGRLINIVVPGLIELARVRLAEGAPDEAARLLGQARDAAQASGIPRAMGRVIPWQARLALLQGDVAGATALLEAMSDGTGETTIAHLACLARVQMAAGKWEAALDTLGQLSNQAQATQEEGARLEGMVLAARCYEALGRRSEALATRAEAVALAEPEGYVRLFLDEGLSSAPAPVGLVEPLSDRELEVLRLIDQGATNQEVAQRLFISINTVKKHTTNIFGKLGAESRTRATARARELGYL